METSTQVTIEALRDGDDSAWDQIHPVLWGVAIKAIEKSHGYFPEGDKEDLAATSIEKLMRSVKTVKDLGHLNRRCAIIALQAVVDLIRSRSRQKRDSSKVSSLDQMVEEAGDKGLPPQQTVSAEVEAMVEMVHEAISRLDPKYRDLVHDYYVEECTQAELAWKYRLPEGTVASRLRRGKKQLDEILEKLKALKEISPE